MKLQIIYIIQHESLALLILPQLHANSFVPQYLMIAKQKARMKTTFSSGWISTTLDGSQQAGEFFMVATIWLPLISLYLLQVLPLTSRGSSPLLSLMEKRGVKQVGSGLSTALSEKSSFKPKVREFFHLTIAYEIPKLHIFLS